METEPKEGKMVATLQCKRDALEIKIRERTQELRKLCIQEAELTGVLPPETPLNPGETPPSFRRRVGTTFSYPENLLNRLKGKEEETLANLELECKIQTNIAEAALSLANDGNASKSIRRKHRLMYQQSQRRLTELETRLNLLRQSARGGQLKYRKKPRPPLNVGDTVDSSNCVLDKADTQKYNNCFQSQGNRNSAIYNSFKCRNSPSTLPIPVRHSFHPTTQGNLQAAYLKHFQNSSSACHTPLHRTDEHIQYNTISINQPSQQYESQVRVRSNYGSLDRRHNSTRSNSSCEPEYYRKSNSHHAIPVPIVQSNSDHLYCDNDLKAEVKSLQNVVLLPNQTYPENSLMRTQSLGDVEHSRKKTDIRAVLKPHEQYGRKTKEKEWRETSLDAGPPTSITPPLQPRATSQIGPPVLQKSSIPRSIDTPPPLPPLPDKPTSPTSPVRQLNIETLVPVESPKNHTVVEVGKWQPYREVTKPFEMSDFYKYSTKFKKNSDHNGNKLTLSQTPSPTTSHHNVLDDNVSHTSPTNRFDLANGNNIDRWQSRNNPREYYTTEDGNIISNGVTYDENNVINFLC